MNPLIRRTLIVVIVVLTPLCFFKGPTLRYCWRTSPGQGAGIWIGRGYVGYISYIAIPGPPDTYPPRFGLSLGDPLAPRAVGGFGWDFGALAYGFPLLPFLCAAVLPLMLLYWRRQRRLRDGQCVHCGYDLRGNVSGRCPECGAAAPRPSDDKNR